MEDKYNPAYILRNENEESKRRDFKIIQKSKANGDRERFICKICGQTASANGTIRTHLYKIHNKAQGPRTPHECKLCSFRDGSFVKISKHMKVEHDMTIIGCDLCEYRSESKHHLRSHMQSVHKKLRFKCELCDFDASRKSRVKNHRLIRHDGFRFNCQLCLFEAPSKYVLKNHVRLNHYKVVCNVCDTICVGEKLLSEHTREMHDNIIFKCPYCEYKSFAQKEIKAHIDDVHPKPVGQVKKNYSSAIKLNEIINHNTQIHNETMNSYEHENIEQIKNEQFDFDNTNADIADPLQLNIKIEPIIDEIEAGEIVKPRYLHDKRIKRQIQLAVAELKLLKTP